MCISNALMTGLRSSAGASTGAKRGGAETVAAVAFASTTMSSSPASSATPGAAAGFAFTTGMLVALLCVCRALAQVKPHEQSHLTGIARATAGRDKYNCTECGGNRGGICVHNRRRARCKECGGGSICEHKRQRRICKECKGRALPGGCCAGACVQVAGRACCVFGTATSDICLCTFQRRCSRKLTRLSLLKRFLFI